MTQEIPGLFRSLTQEEIAEFVAYARTHDPDLNNWILCHPVCRAEWTALGKGPGARK